MGLRQRGSVIGNYATASSNSASGIWTGKEAYTLQKKGTWPVPPTFSLSSSAGTVNEGASVNFTLTTTGIPNGAVIPYTLSGTNVTTTDSANNILTGNFVISNGSSTVSFNANADVTLEGTEIIQMVAAGKTANVTINDTSFPQDAQFPYTVLLLNGDGTNNAQNNTFLDSSTNNFTMTRNGNATQGSFSPYANNWSWYFDGTGDYLVSSGRANIATGEFTIETWIYPTVLNSINTIFENANWDIGQNSGYQIYIKSTGVVGLAASAGVYNSYPEIYASTSAVLLNKWSHVAITRDASNVIRCFINGVLDSTTATYATSLNLQTSQAPTSKFGVIIADGGAYNLFTGYISNFRVVNGSGSCLYTTTFTPSTTPLTAIANTQILACQSNRLKDNGPSLFTFTKTGDVAVKKFSPLTLSSAYSPATFGGSAYYDGTGDSLASPQNSTFNLSTGDWTIEAWYYSFSILSQSARYMTFTPSSGAVYGVLPGNNAFILNQFGTSSPISTSIPPTLYAWQHIALVKSGSTTTLYINGVAGGSGTVSWVNADTTIFFGGNTGSYAYDYSGYISGARVVKGTAVYTGNFTPPIAPVLTSGSSAPYTNTANVNTTFAAANTALLCNFTNAGIYDGTMISNFETAGDSKVSSTQSKFGGSAMFFDGTGDYIAAQASPDWALGSNCTVECWIHPTSAPGTARVINNGVSGSGIDIYYSSGRIGFCDAGYTTATLPLNTWTHIACVLNNGTMKIYFNGVSQALNSTTTGFNLTATAALWVGGISGYSQFFQGYLDDVRITKGFARYTTDFTVPTRAFAGI
jgi:hypothetical protein